MHKIFLKTRDEKLAIITCSTLMIEHTYFLIALLLRTMYHIDLSEASLAWVPWVPSIHDFSDFIQITGVPTSKTSK